MCQICSKSVEFYESYGETHFGVFFMPHSVDILSLGNESIDRDDLYNVNETMGVLNQGIHSLYP